ncbi:MAG: class I SAM-dependent methyltransferase [Deltaproteobacteria bacterium]|nr:class I SAM-dependent methyltransferase [Deltaproteobacteria bacterium]MBW2724000.1 class I SAM-dependent methyltransferase [Deltaproteobacteria bacterium]
MSQLTFTGERLHAGSSLFGVDLARHRAPYSYALDYAGLGRVLDLGCGSGYGTAELADSLPRVVGLDRIPPDEMNHRDNIDWVRADLGGNPLALASFGLIVSFQVIEHLEDPHIYLDSISRLLAPGGTAILTTPNILTSDKINPFHVHEYAADELRDCLAPYFDEVVMHGVGLSANVKPYFDTRLERIAKVMRIDPLGLRNLLPRNWVAWLFAKGALRVRRGIQDSDAGMPNATLCDFPIAPSDPADIDLLAICRKNPGLTDSATVAR